MTNFENSNPSPVKSATRATVQAITTNLARIGRTGALRHRK